MYTNFNVWPDFGKPTELSHLVFWEILIKNIETIMVFLCYTVATLDILHFHNHCNITSGTYKEVDIWMGRVVSTVDSRRWVKPFVRIVWTRYESKKCQQLTRTSEGLRDVSLPLGWTHINVIYWSTKIIS